MTQDADLFDLIRQLRTELEWAARTGIEPIRIAPPTTPPPAPRPIAPPAQRPAATTPSEPPPPKPIAPPPPVAAQPAPPQAAPPPRTFTPPPQSSAAPPRPAASAGAPPAPAVDEPSAGTKARAALAVLGAKPTLEQIREVLGDCTRCKLHRLGRTQIVFGVGSPSAELMFVGEGPGADED